jgi:pyrroloquinoline quinone (PQQ) biosynthesis protein C
MSNECWEQLANEKDKEIDYLRSQLAVALGVNPEDIETHALHVYEYRQKLESYDLLVTTIRNILTDAGIPDHEEYPDEDVDEREKSLRTGGRMIPLDRRVKMLVERYNQLQEHIWRAE